MFFVQVDHQLMCLSSLDVTGDGSPEVVSVNQLETIICDNKSEPCILGELLLGRSDLHHQPGQAGGQVRDRYVCFVSLAFILVLMTSFN